MEEVLRKLPNGDHGQGIEIQTYSAQASQIEKKSKTCTKMSGRNAPCFALSPCIMRKLSILRTNQYTEKMKGHVNKISRLILKKFDVNEHINNMSSYRLSFFENLILCRGLKFFYTSKSFTHRNSSQLWQGLLENRAIIRRCRWKGTGLLNVTFNRLELHSAYKS